MDTAVKVVSFLFGIAVSVVSTVFVIGRKLGNAETERKSEATLNENAHTTLDKRVEEADRKARAAHTRIDDVSQRVTRLEAENENTAKTLAHSMEQLQRALSDTNKRIDALLELLANGSKAGGRSGGHQ